MNILAISGSARKESTNTYLLKEVSRLVLPRVNIEVFHSLDAIPVFNPDNEGDKTPASVVALCKKIAQCDGLIVSSPEYARSIPGGLKNAIDWLISRDEMIGKPIAVLHASHRGRDLLASLRRVLATVSENFTTELFLEIPLVGKDKNEIREIVHLEKNRLLVNHFVSDFCAFIETI